MTTKKGHQKTEGKFVPFRGPHSGCVSEGTQKLHAGIKYQGQRSNTLNVIRLNTSESDEQLIIIIIIITAFV